MTTPVTDDLRAALAKTHRTIRDPFTGRDVQISDDLCDRLRGRYACGPTMANGEPEFGWREHQTTPIQHEAADVIVDLSTRLANCKVTISVVEEQREQYREKMKAAHADAERLRARVAELEKALKPFALYAKHRPGIDFGDGEIGEYFHHGIRCSILTEDLRHACFILLPDLEGARHGDAE